MASELSTEQRTRLIELVREHPALYDMKHAEYSNRDVKRQLWEQVAEQLEIPGLNADVAYTKFKNAKDNYDRLRKKMKLRSSSGRMTHPPRWTHYDQMRFMDGASQPLASTAGTSGLRVRHHDTRPGARSRGETPVAKRAPRLSTQAAEQEAFADDSEEMKMETFEMEEDNLCGDATSSHEKETPVQHVHAGTLCNKCATLQAQLERSEAEKEQLRKVNDQLKKGTDQLRAFVK